MDVLIHTDGFTAAEDLKEFINNKVSKLETYYDKIISTDVYLKFENSQQVKEKKSEIKLNIPGSTLYAEHTAKTFEEATHDAVESLRRQVKKHKEKQRQTS